MAGRVLPRSPYMENLGGTGFSPFISTLASTSQAQAPPIAPGSSPSDQVELQNTLPKGILPIEFSTINLAGTATDVQLFKVVADATTASGRNVRCIPPFRGSIVALTLASSDAKTAGSASFTVFREGIATAAILIWTTGVTSGLASFAAGTIPFAAGQKLDVRSTTSGFTPTTSDVEVYMYLAQDVD